MKSTLARQKFTLSKKVFEGFVFPDRTEFTDIQNQHIVFLASWVLLMNKYAGQESFRISYYDFALTDELLFEINLSNIHTCSDLIRLLTNKINNQEQIINDQEDDIDENVPINFSIFERYHEGLDFSNHNAIEINPASRLDQSTASLQMFHNKGIFGGWVLYKTEVFEAFMADKMRDHYLNLVIGILENPLQAINKISMIGTSELKTLLQEWQGPEVDFSDGGCLHQAFERTVNMYPDQEALMYKDQAYTYREVNQRANYIAQCLLDQGLQPGEFVGVLLDLSVDALVALLGILKAGGSFVAMDASHPISRHQFMIQDCGIKTLITHTDHKDKKLLPDENIILTDNINWPNNLKAEDPNLTINPEQIAYIMYTSGSTGNPKGVMIAHQQIVHNLYITAKRYELTAGNRILSFISLGFDVTISKLFATFMTGGSAILPTTEDIMDVHKLIAMLQKYKPIFFPSTPAILRMLNQINPDLSFVNIITTGGESAKYSDFDNIIKQCKIMNIYGPTEATVSSSSYVIPSDGWDLTRRIPIGKPNPNCRIYILDKDLNPTPIGVFGTLFIGGKGITNGYLNNPELTDSKFIPDPYSPGNRLYNSGDIARWLPDGNLDFLGRKDNQIKIRTFRIEIEEVEKNLISSDLLLESKIIVIDGENGDKTMVACVVPKTNVNFSILKLKNYLSDHLPSPVIPNEYILLEKLPLNRSNKVDTKKLFKLYQEGQQLSLGKTEDFQNHIEKEIAEFWKEKLNKQLASRSDNFFHLGGHSLQVMQLKIHIKNTFEVDIPVKVIFDNQTISQISDYVLAELELHGKEKAWIGIEQTQQEQMLDFKEVKTPKHDHKAKALKTWKNFIKNRKSTRKLLKKAFIGHINSRSLSFHEERLWFLYKLQQGQCMYNILKAYNLRGLINPQNLEKSLNLVLQKHDNLRKNFFEKDGEVHSQVLTGIALKLRTKVCNSVSELDDNFSSIIDTESYTPFNLSNEILIRATLLTDQHTNHKLVISTHHIVADGWSFEIFMKDFCTYYEALEKHEKVQIESLTKEYTNYPIYYKNLISSSLLNNQLAFWKEKLIGKTEKLNLPYDRDNKASGPGNGGYEEILFPIDLAKPLIEFSQKSGATTFMVFLSAFHSLLHKYTGQENVHCGVPFADRQQEETKNLIGFFVNTIILTSNQKAGSTFLENLKDTRENVLTSFHNKDLPYDMLADVLRKESGIETNDLIQVLFDFQHSFETASTIGSASIENIKLKNYLSKFDITVSVSEQKEGYLLYAEYKREAFTSETIKRFLLCYKTLLEQVAQNPEIVLDDIELINPEEKKIILQDWNNTSVEIPQEPIHRLFEKTVLQRPNDLALITDEVELTYSQLNQKANILAHHLCQYDLQKDELIGILMDESEHSTIAQLAILKAGAGFVPLDPSNPVERLEHMVKKCQIRFIITRTSYSKILRPDNLTLISLDDPNLIKNQHIENLTVEVKPSDYAYVMFTSGSTGMPKAVGVEHQSVVRLVVNCNFTHLDYNTRVLKTGAFSFDASTLEIWGALLNGGRLYIYPKTILLDPSQIKEKINENGITHAWFTSSWLNQLVDLDKDIFGSLKYLMTGGDKLSAKHINKIRRAFPSLNIMNGYGPTENTTFSLTYTIEEKQEDSIPIGKPIANSTVYILDNKLNMQPIGVRGELYVGGLGVARCYVNDPELTQAKFIDDPYNSGQKMYKTGDWGRWMNNGLVEFLGRNDDQVKIRGYRVELGEIENAICSHPQVEEAAILIKDMAGEKQLVAFYKSKTPIEHEELTSFLKQVLMDAMIPASFNYLSEMPLTTNGKTDRKKLATLNTKTTEKKPEVLPSNAIERKLAAIFAEVLGRTSVGVTESFFHAGGHSLMATKLMAKIEKAFDKNLPLSLLFQAPTVKDLAAIIAGPDFNSVGLVPIQPKGNRTPIFLLPGYLFYYNLANSMGNNQPLYGFEPIPKFKTEEIAAHYIDQIKKVQPEGPYFIGGYCASGILAFEMAQQMHEAGLELGWLALFESYTPEATVAKASGKYLEDKLIYWKSGLFSSSWKGRYNLLKSESAKLFKYFFKNTFRKILTDYTLKPFDGNMVLFKAKDGMVGSANDPYMGWSKYCDANKVHTVEISGDHNTIFKTPNVKLIGDQLKDQMDKYLFQRKEKN
jgi:amino acid adenylation domain-containing protein